MGGWVGCRAGLDTVEKKKYLPIELGLLGHLTFTIITLQIKPPKTTNQS
jgi:hypothetical protein